MTDSSAMLRQIALLRHPVLRTLAGPTDLPALAAVRALIAGMLATLADSDGFGIPSPHVDESAALFIVASRPNPRDPAAPAPESDSGR
jgi:peptide deformylase